MAITNPGMFPFQPCIPFDRARRETPLPEVPNNPQAGSLVIIDSFQDSYTGAAHGNIAAYAAEHHGFRGKIYAEQVGDNAGLSPWIQVDRAESALSNGPLSPKDARGAVEDYLRSAQVATVQELTGDLNKVNKQGLKDSAVNISYGTSPQSEARRLYSTVRNAPQELNQWSSPMARESYQQSQNILGAYGIDPSKFYSPDLKVSGPARLALQQQLIDAGIKGLNSPEMTQAKAAYQTAVRGVEAHNNSVVVSAGNEGEVLKYFQSEAGGRKVSISAAAKMNVLVNSDVTSVGATRWKDSKTESIAGYSNRDSQVDIYASGSVGNGEDQNRMKTAGTSFAAPRVAAMMATLHGTRPGTPSSAVENLMRNRLTHDLGEDKVLDFSLAESYMRRGTF